MTIDNKTKHLNLPLPHEDNLLEEDVLRLREAFAGLDAHAEQTEDALAGKADAAAVSAALATKADAAATQTSLNAKANKTEIEAALAEHLAKSAASEVGHVQLATDAEAVAGTVVSRAVSPKQLKAAADAVTADVTDTSRNDHAASYKSSGSGATATGFKLLNNTDIGALFGKIDDVTLTTSGAGNYVGSIEVAVSGKTAQITQNKIGPTYCSHCGYCTYCSYPATSNASQSNYNTSTSTYSLEGGGSSTFTLRRTNCNCNCNCGG